VIALFLAPQAWAVSQVEGPPLDRLLAPQGRPLLALVQRKVDRRQSIFGDTSPAAA